MWYKGFRAVRRQAMKGKDHFEPGNKQEKPYDCPSLLPGERFQFLDSGTSGKNPGRGCSFLWTEESEPGV